MYVGAQVLKFFAPITKNTSIFASIYKCFVDIEHKFLLKYFGSIIFMGV